MKKRSLAMLLTVFSVFATVSCQAVEGPVGPKGDTGETGPAGPKGDTGAKGEQGDTGLTAFGCTIVSSENGFVTVDKGSAVVGSDVTFTITPTNDATVLGLKLNDTTVYEADLTKNENGSYSYTTKMVENGFVVVGLFVGDDSKANIVVEGYDKDNVPTGYEGEVIALPTAKAIDKYGTDLSSYLTITDVTKGVSEENTTIANGNFVSDVTGVHTLKYVVTNPKTNEVINEKTININVVMKIVKDCTDSRDLTIENETTNPTMSIANKGIFGLSFNFEASKTYYAEVVVSKLTQNVANQIITVSNNVTENGVPTGGMYYEGIKMNGGEGFEFATSKYLIGDSAWGDFGGGAKCWHDQSFVNGRSGMDINPNTKAIKMAVARNNDTFYYFMDDKLLSIAKYPELKELDTYPGMAFYGGDHTGIKATMSDFKFIKDAKGVESKINELNTATFNYFSCWGNSKTNNFATFNGNSFTWKEEGSTTNDNMNANIVTPLVNLFGNWEASYDVKTNKIGDSDGWGKLMLDIRTLQDKKCVTTMHTTIGGSKTYYEALMNSCEVGSQTGTNFQSEFAKAFGGSVSRDTELHFNIKCEVNDKVETYTITITDKNDENKTYTFTETVTYTGSYEYLAGGPKFLLFKSQKYSGTISNFEFK